LTRSAAAPFREPPTLVLGDIRLEKGLTCSWFGSVALCESVVLADRLCLVQVQKITKFQRLKRQQLGDGASTADISSWIESLQRRGIDTDKIVDSHHEHQRCFQK
jgi:hypothetical protein